MAFGNGPKMKPFGRRGEHFLQTGISVRWCYVLAVSLFTRLRVWNTRGFQVRGTSSLRCWGSVPLPAPADGSAAPLLPQRPDGL